MLRDFRLGDAPQAFEFLTHEFPEEEALLGMRPEGLERIVRRLFRWDARIALGAMRLVGRPPFRFFVIEDGRRIVGTTLLTFPPSAGYISTVVVDPAHRGRGYARRLLEAARAATARRRRSFVVLDVLESNAPARRLYETSGYRMLRSTGYLVQDTSMPTREEGAEPAGIRLFRRADAWPLAAIAQRVALPEVARVLPVTPDALIGSGWAGRLLYSDSASWVVDRGHGPEAYLTATVSPATYAAHLSAPIVAESVDPATVTALVRTAVRWLAEKNAPRIVGMIPEEDHRGRVALEEVGFHRALAILTLYRPSA